MYTHSSKTQTQQQQNVYFRRIKASQTGKARNNPRTSCKIFFYMTDNAAAKIIVVTSNEDC